MIGFAFRETMRGSYYLLEAPERDRPIEFTATVSAGTLLGFARTRVAELRGEVRADGLARCAPLEGTLAFRLDEERLRYDFGFRTDDGAALRFRGQKDYVVFRPRDSISVLPASLYDASEREIGRATVRFDLRNDTSKLLRSFRLRLV